MNKMKFKPNYAVAPCIHFIEILSFWTGLEQEEIEKFLKNELPITPRIACGLEKITGMNSDFWLTLEKNYQEALIRIEKERKIDS